MVLISLCLPQCVTRVLLFRRASARQTKSLKSVLVRETRLRIGKGKALHGSRHRPIHGRSAVTHKTSSGQVCPSSTNITYRSLLTNPIHPGLSSVARHHHPQRPLPELVLARPLSPIPPPDLSRGHANVPARIRDVIGRAARFRALVSSIRERTVLRQSRPPHEA